MITRIDSYGIARIGYTFDNGVRLSIIFTDMSYSDNYDLWKREGFDKKHDSFTSTTVEILQTDGNKALNGWISKHYGQYESREDPIAYVPVSALPAILKRADSQVYKEKEA
jgi:hypothetical protein